MISIPSVSLRMLPSKDHQEEEGSDDDVPLSIRKKRQAAKDHDDLSQSKRTNHREEDGSDDDVPLAIRKKRRHLEDDDLQRSKRMENKPNRIESVDTGKGLESYEIWLPDEVWRGIMHLLSPLSLQALGSCSRQLLLLSREPELWRQLTINWHAIKALKGGKHKAVDMVIKRATKIKSLALKNQPFEKIKSNSVVAVVRKAGSSLTSLTFSAEMVLTNSAVATLSSLRSLKLLELPGNLVKTSGCQAIASLSLLTSFKMPGAEEVTSEDLVTIVSALPQLQVLDISLGRPSYLDYIDYMLLDSRTNKGCTDSVLVALAVSCPNLIHLAVDQCKRITGKGLRALSERLTKLQHLSLDGCDNVNDSSIVRVVTASTDLTYLSLGGIGEGCVVKDTSLKALATHCHKLNYLNLCGSAWISEWGVSRLVEALGPQHLKYLCICGMRRLGRAFSEELAAQWKDMEVVHQLLPKPVRNRSKKF